MSEPREGAQTTASPDPVVESEETLRSFGEAEITATVELRCAQLEVLQNWQDRHRLAFGDRWVTDIGREVEYWVLLLEAADRLPPDLTRTLHTKEAAAGLWTSLLAR